MQFLWAALRGRSFRPWTIVLPFTLAGPDKWIEIGQTIVFGLSFSCLIMSITALPFLRASTRAVVAFLLVMLALSPGLISWNLLILSESLSVSYSVFVVALLLRYYASERALFLALGGISAGFSILSKPLLAIVFIPLILILVVWSIRRVGWILKPSDDNARRVLANPRFWLAVAVTVFSLLTSIWYVSRQDATRYAEIAPTQEDSIVHLITTDDPLNSLVRQSLSGTTIPKCVPLAHATPIDAFTALESELLQTCPQFRSWATDNFARWYLGFVLQHPSWARDYVSNLMPYALVTQLREPVTSLAIPPVSDTLWGAFSVPPYPSQAVTSQLQPESFEDPMLAVVFGVNLFAIWLLLKKRHRSLFGEGGTRLLLALVGLVDLSLITIVVQLLILPSSALEVARIALEANVLLRVGLIVAVGIVGEFLWTEFRRTRVPRVSTSRSEVAVAGLPSPDLGAGNVGRVGFTALGVT